MAENTGNFREILVIMGKLISCQLENLKYVLTAIHIDM